MTSSQWFQGANSQAKRVSLKPEGMDNCKTFESLFNENALKLLCLTIEIGEFVRLYELFLFMYSSY